MNRKALVTLGTVLACVLAAGVGWGSLRAEGHHHKSPHILTFDTMYGVEGQLLGATNAIRGITGDESPWVINHFIRGHLDTDGRLVIQVKGLVFGNDPSVPPNLVGKNDETTYRGGVSCLSEDANGAIITSNVFTLGSPSSVNGDSFIDEKVILPSPCVAPIVFVLAGSEDKWFAVTGFEAGSTSQPGHDHQDQDQDHD
jgi:hypothetical protein